MFIGGSSEEERTKATANVVGEELAGQFGGREDVVVYRESDIEELREKAKEEHRSPLKMIQEIIGDNPDKKIVFVFPLYLKEFSLRPHHRDKETGEHTQYVKELLRRTGADEREAALEWFRNEGKIETPEGVLEVPSPQETAETHIRGINRLCEFARQFIGDRPLSIGLVGHGWQLDALAVYLANNGVVNVESFEELFGGEPLEQPEAGRVRIREEGTVFIYRGREYEVPLDILKKEE